MNATGNIVRRSFRVPPLSWPVPPRGYKINSIQKLIESRHIRGGLNKGLPPIYLRQNWKGGRGVLKNPDVTTLPDGAYLYLIEYDPKSNRYYKQYVPIINLIEFGARHFQLPTYTEGRIIIAAGELSKEKGMVRFNLESGTYTRPLMAMTKKAGINNSVYRNIVENAFRNARPGLQYTNGILVPQVPARLRNLMKVPPNSLSFFFANKPTEALRARPEFLSVPARNVLARQHARRVASGESSNENSSPSPVRRSPRLKRYRNNGGPTNRK